MHKKIHRNRNELLFIILQSRLQTRHHPMHSAVGVHALSCRLYEASTHLFSEPLPTTMNQYT